MTSAAAATPTAINPTIGARPALFNPPAPLGVDVDALNPDTMPGIALRQTRRHGDRLHLKVKLAGAWLPVTWDEMHASTVAVGAALVHARVAARERVAILSENRLEWLASDFGIQMAGAVVVPIYSSSTAEMVATILADCEAVAVICSTPKQAAKVTEVAGSLPKLLVRVIMQEAADGFTTLGDLVAAASVEDVATLEGRASAIVPDDPVTIIYTSGTTGVPKGVVLTQANVVESCRSLLERVTLYDSDHGISFLPWAHVYERVQGTFAGMIAGVSASIAPDLDHIGQDLRSERPTLMNGVPRVYEKMQEAIVAQIRAAGGRRAAVGLRGLDDAVAAARLRRQGKKVPFLLRLRSRIWDRLVIDRIRAGLGGRVRIFSSGGGPINMATLEFFDGLGIAIIEGYGLTETTGGVTTNDPTNPRFGTVGRATPGHEIRIAPDGEILIKGPGVMKGYFNNPAATEEVLQDGWFATGDIGELDADGYLRITDRKKDLIVTAGGKNVAPAPIEALIMQDPLVERAVVIGDRRKYLIALVVPNFVTLRGWARTNGVTDEDPAALARHPKVTQLYADIAERASSQLARYETIKKVAVLERDLDEARGELTPTLKAKRKVVTEHFADVIDSLYS